MKMNWGFLVISNKKNGFKKTLLTGSGLVDLQTRRDDGTEANFHSILPTSLSISLFKVQVSSSSVLQEQILICMWK